MLWRVRTTLPDRPGTLATLAQRCGAAGVNILGMQIFPGGEEVTDEFVLSTPEDWGEAEITALLQQSGGGSVVVHAATDAALADQPTRYVHAARAVLERPMSFPDVVARLFDAEPDPVEPGPGDEGVRGSTHDTMEMTVGEVQVQVHRRAPFTLTERARGAAMAELVSDVLQRTRDLALASSGGRRLGAGATPEYDVSGDSVIAQVGGITVGTARLERAPDDADEQVVRGLDLRVEPGWQRRGIGSRLLLDGARLARTRGIEEIVLTARSDNQAVLPMVLSTGLRGRIRMAGDMLTVRISVRDLKPLPARR